jgi:hypothetical protein
VALLLRGVRAAADFPAVVGKTERTFAARSPGRRQLDAMEGTCHRQDSVQRFFARVDGQQHVVIPDITCAGRRPPRGGPANGR